MAKVNSQKYSKALLEVAQEQSKLEEILAEVAQVAELFESQNLTKFFSDDVYSADIKSQVVDTLNNSASDLMRNFLNTVRLNGRLADLYEILQEVKNTADDMFKIADVEVISSVALTENQIQKFEQLTKAKFDLNEVKVINTVDEKILGGFIISSRGKIIDSSIKTQLAKIANEIL
ncbi:F0F1 ATP synthase subunit delta [Lactococcus nasutitermitis]|uniref:ATP synthase subunit delta n=1 Tax=Lactococcus nasutitermitis TaxID=1652957 RepID=A0ABV9JES6_9LACT|nr:F0F1 ATP synthase subunit delta [Lactococcus nasutitermitis]